MNNKSSENFRLKNKPNQCNKLPQDKKKLLHSVTLVDKQTNVKSWVPHLF